MRAVSVEISLYGDQCTVPDFKREIVIIAVGQYIELSGLGIEYFRAYFGNAVAVKVARIHFLYGISAYYNRTVTVTDAVNSRAVHAEYSVVYFKSRFVIVRAFIIVYFGYSVLRFRRAVYFICGGNGNIRF